MLGTIILVFLQLGGSWWISNRLLDVVPLAGPLKLILLVVVVSLLVWIIGVLASEFIKDVPKPTPNVIMSSIFVAGLLVAVNIIPLFNDYVIPLRETYLPGIRISHFPVIGAVAGYYMSK